jgi:hypothetical protein
MPRLRNGWTITSRSFSKNLPDDIQADSASIDFPIPQRLTCSVRSPHATSVSSGITFNQRLADRMKDTPAVITIQRTAC